MEQKNLSIAPNLLDRWKRVARKIGDVQSRILLTVFYLFIMGPFALLVKRSDPLGIKGGRSRGWILRNDANNTSMKRATEQS
jgi:hypothetical protein